MVTTNTAPKRYNVTEVAKLSGLTAAALRVWELRYGWPRPSRDPHNGYRVYRMADVENATKIAAYIAEGWSIGQLIVDGIPTWPAKDAKPPLLAHGVKSRFVRVEKRPKAKAKPAPAKPADDSDECKRCGADGGDPLICDACSATFCSKCDTGGKCPSCGEPLP